MTPVGDPGSAWVGSMDKLAFDTGPPRRVDLALEPNFTVGCLAVRPSRREVEGTGIQRTLQRKVMQVLVALATSRSEVVSRRELVQRCWAGLSVSDDAVDRCIAQLRALAAVWPEVPFAICTIPGVGYQLQPTQPPGGPSVALQRAHRPKLAVLPFISLSADPSQDYFAVGMVEEIVTLLSRFTTSFEVISAGPGLFMDGRSVTPRDAARELDVSYLLEGSIRRDDHRIRVTVHLTDSPSGVERWADRIEETSGDLFSVQDRVAEKVAGALETVIEDIGLATAVRREPTDLDAYDLLLQAMELFRQPGRKPMLESIELLERAVALDPRFSIALGHSAVCHRQIVDHEWSDDIAMFRRRGLEYAERALAAAPRDARVVAHVAAGLSGLEDGIDRSLALADEAIALNSASSFAWLISGSLRLRAGQPDHAAAHLERSLLLDPISNRSGFSRMYLASARFQQRRFEEALALFRTTTHRLPLSHAILASLHGHLRDVDTARTEYEAFESSEAGSLQKFIDIWFSSEPHRTLFVEGLAAARLR